MKAVSLRTYHSYSFDAYVFEIDFDNGQRVQVKFSGLEVVHIPARNLPWALYTKLHHAILHSPAGWWLWRQTQPSVHALVMKGFLLPRPA